MRIYDADSDRTLGSIDLFLTHTDIEELIDVLRGLQTDDTGARTQMVEPAPVEPEYARELNLALYDEGDVPAEWTERDGEIVLEDR